MLRYRQRLVMMEEYALEYINHEVLCRRSTYRADKYKYLLAYQELAKKLAIRPLYARALERQFRKYFFSKMKAMVREGLTDISQMPEEPRWMRFVEEKLNTIPTLLQDLNRRRQAKSTSPDEVVSALCTQATLRGTLCAREVYGSVARELRLSARVSDLHAAWVSAQRVSLRFLSISSRAGDVQDSALSLSHAQVADVVLLHTDVNTLHLVTDESDNIEAETKALAILWRLVQRHRLEERAPPRSRVRAQRWTRAYHGYLASNRLATLVVLQRRWHELKLRARARALARHAHRHAHGHARGHVHGHAHGYAHKHAHGQAHGHAHVHAPHANAPPLTDLDVAILKKYPHVVTSPLASWLTLVRRGSIVTQLLSDVESDQDSDECDKQVFPEDAAKPTAKLDPQQGNNPSKTKPVVNVDHDTVVSGYKDLHCNENRDITDILKTLDPSKVTTEIFIESDTECEIPDAVYNSENGPYDKNSKVDISVKEEPRTMANRIVFANDNDITIQEIDDEIIEGNFDTQLLMNTRVKLTRVEDTPAWRQYAKENKCINASYFASDDVSIKSETEDVDSAVTENKMVIIFEDDSDVVDSDYEEEAPAKIPRLNSAGVAGEPQVSYPDLQSQNAGQNSDAGKQKSGKTQAQKIKDHYEVIDSGDVATIANKEIISMTDLATLLADLPTAGKVGPVSTTGDEYCCPARQHIKISDHQQSLGLPPLPPHTHDNGPCTCCCGNIPDQSAREQADVDLKALKNDITAILKLSIMRKEKKAQLNQRSARPPRKKLNKTVKKNNKKSSTEGTAATAVTVPKTTEYVANTTLTEESKSQSTKNPTLEGAKKASTSSLEGYDEWIRQKNVNTQFFLLQGVNKKDKPKTATIPTEVTPAAENTSYKPPKSYLRLSSQENNTHVLQNEAQYFEVNKMQNNAITQQFEVNKIQNKGFTQKFEVNKMQNNGFTQKIEVNNIQNNAITEQLEVIKIKNKANIQQFEVNKMQYNANIQQFEVNKIQYDANTQNNEENRHCNQITKANDIPVKFRDTSICLAKHQNEIIERDDITVNIGETSISASGKNKDLLQKLYTYVINRRDEQVDKVISNKRDEQNDIIIISDEDSREETEELTEEIQAPAKETQVHADETQALEEETQAPAEVTQALAEETAAPYTSESIFTAVYAASNKLIELNNAYKNAFEEPPTTNMQSLTAPHIIDSRGESLSINRKEVFRTSKQTQKNSVLVASTNSRKPIVHQAPTTYNTLERPRQEKFCQDAISGQSATNNGRNPNYLMVLPYIVPKPADKQIFPNQLDYPRVVPFIQRESNNAQRSCKMCSTLPGDQIREPLPLSEHTGGQSASTTSDNPIPPQLNQPETTTLNQSSLICNTKSGDSIVIPNVQPASISGQTPPTTSTNPMPVPLIRPETSIEKNCSKNCNTTSGNLITPPMLPEPTIGQTTPTKLARVPFIRRDIIGQSTSSIRNTSGNQYIAPLIQPEPTSGQIIPIERNSSISVPCKRRYSIAPRTLSIRSTSNNRIITPLIPPEPTSGQTASIESNESIPELFYQQEDFRPRTSSIRSSTSVNRFTAPSMQPESTSGQTALIESHNSIVMPFNRRDNPTGHRRSFIRSPTSSNRFMAPLTQPIPTHYIRRDTTPGKKTFTPSTNNLIVCPFILQETTDSQHSDTISNNSLVPASTNVLMSPTNHSVDSNTGIVASVNPPKVISERNVATDCRTNLDNNTVALVVEALPKPEECGRQIAVTKPRKVKPAPLLIPESISMQNDFTNNGPKSNIVPPGIDMLQNSNVELQYANECTTKSKPSIPSSKSIKVLSSITLNQNTGPRSPLNKPSSSRKNTQSFMNKDERKSDKESPTRAKGVVDVNKSALNKIIIPKEARSSKSKTKSSAVPLLYNDADTMEADNSQHTIPLNSNISKFDEEYDEWLKHKNVNKQFFKPPGTPMEDIIVTMKTKKGKYYDKIKKKLKRKEKIKKHKHKKYKHYKETTEVVTDSDTSVESDTAILDAPVENQMSTLREIPLPSEEIESETLMHNALVKNKTSCQEKKTPHREMQLRLDRVQIERKISVHDTISSSDDGATPSKIPRPNSDCKIFSFCPLGQNEKILQNLTLCTDGSLEPSVHNETILHDIQDNHKIEAESLINNLQVASAETEHNSMDCSELLLHIKSDSRKIKLDSQSDRSELMSYDLPFCSETSYYSQIPLYEAYQREMNYHARCLNEPLLMLNPPPPPPPLPASPSPQDAQELAETLEESALLEVPSMDEIGKTLKRLPSVEGTSEWYSEIRALVESPTLPKLRIRVVQKSAINQTDETTTATITEEVVAQPDDTTLRSDVKIDEIPLPEVEPPAIDVSLNDIPLPIEQPPVEVILLSCVGPQNSDTLVSKIPKIHMECVADVLSKESQPAQSPDSVS